MSRPYEKIEPQIEDTFVGTLGIVRAGHSCFKLVELKGDESRQQQVTVPQSWI